MHVAGLPALWMSDQNSQQQVEAHVQGIESAEGELALQPLLHLPPCEATPQNLQAATAYLHHQLWLNRWKWHI